MATRPAKPKMEPRYVTRDAAATYASCSARTIDSILSDPTTGVHRYEIRRDPRIDLNELDAYMARNQWSR